MNVKILVLLLVLGVGALVSAEEMRLHLLVDKSNDLVINLSLYDRKGEKEDLPGPMPRLDDDSWKNMGYYTFNPISLSMSLKDLNCFEITANEEIEVLSLLVYNEDSSDMRAFDFIFETDPPMSFLKVPVGKSVKHCGLICKDAGNRTVPCPTL